MNDVPTRGATEPAQRWTRAPLASWTVRALAYLLPVATAWAAVRLSSRWYFRPDGLPGLGAWLLQAIAVSALVSLAVDRLSRRLLPLAAMLNLSLAFPDQAPSRFGVALRAGSTRQLETRIAQITSEGLGDDPQQATERALELVAALGHHDRKTRGHTERVRAHADLIARELGLSRQDRLFLAWGVLLHDIGKLTVPSEILNKETPLSSQEWAVLRRHPADGQAILAPLAGWLDDWIRAAGDHHERWDGAGYPAGLSGTGISLAGRITAVADAYDVITSVRSYKVPMSVAAAREELVRCSGTQFDPAVVRALLSASVGRRLNGGPLAWLAELPSLGRITSAMANSATTVIAAGAAVAVVVSGLAGAANPATNETAAGASSAIAADGGELAFHLGPAAEVDAVPAPSRVTGPDQPTTAATPPETTVDDGPIPPSTTTGPSSTTRVLTNATARAPSPTATTARATSSTKAIAPSTTAAPATTTTTPTGYNAYLINPGTGSTNATSPLYLSTIAPWSGGLPNYDRDRDNRPGLGLRVGSAGLTTSDLTRYQDWLEIVLSPRPLSGPASVTLYLGASGLTGGEAIGMRVALYRCNQGCGSPVATGDWTGTSQDGVYQSATVPLGSIDQPISFGETIKIRVVVPDSLSSTDIVLAYDSTIYPSRLTIG